MDCINSMVKRSLGGFMCGGQARESGGCKAKKRDGGRRLAHHNKLVVSKLKVWLASYDVNDGKPTKGRRGYVNLQDGESGPR